MTAIHLEQHFMVNAPNEIFEQCDALMEALVDLEDAHVHSASVSADREKGLVIVEVVGEGPTRLEAELNALNRIHHALTQRVGVVIQEVEGSRQVEDLIPA